MNNFDLNGAITQWRKRLSWRDAFSDADLDEMESHLRDEIESLVASGKSEQEAFHQTIRSFDEDMKLAWRFNQANWEKVMIKRTRYAPIMIGNYFKVAIRNLLKHKGYSFINITGLAIGITCSVLIFLFVQHELSYDHFHESADRLYRVGLTFTHEGRPPMQHANTPGALGPALLAEIPLIEAAARISIKAPAYVTYQDARFYEDNVRWVDASIFKIFSFPFLKGNPQTALNTPYSVVITKKIAHKYFGDHDPIGEILTVRDSLSFTVTGVLTQHATPSHFVFDMLLHDPSMQTGNWGTFNHYTYIRLTKTATHQEAESQLRNIFTHFNPEIETKRKFTMQFFLQPITDIYLHSRLLFEIGPTSTMATLTIFSSIALFILLIACANFINLSIAQSFNRIREVGMRKVVGAQRQQLIRQFLGESLLTATIALTFALFFIDLTMPTFNAFTQKHITLNLNSNTLCVLIGLAFAIGLGAGFYPAFLLSRFHPIEVIKGTHRSLYSATTLRKGLVIFQFTISIVLLISTSIVNQQLQHMKNQNVGFQKDQIVLVKWRWNPDIQKRYQTIKKALLKHPQVTHITASHSIPGSIMPNMGFYAEGGTRGHIDMLLVDHDFVKTYGLNIIAGRDFSQEMPTDANNAILINESAVLDLGWKTPQKALGKEFKMPSYGGKVVGIIKDFHFYGLQTTIQPLVLDIAPFMFMYFSIRINGNNISQTLDALARIWSIQVPNRPFDYSFLDADFDSQYRSEERMDRMCFIFSTLAILIGCLGLFSLAAFSAEQRKKEIGIRKVLGASINSMIFLLTRDFVKLILIANCIAWPIAYYIMTQWLQDFAYRTTLSINTFFLCGLIALIIALLTISYQAIKAAQANPIDSLRYE